LHNDRAFQTFWTPCGLALAVCLAGCSLNPQPLPPGTTEPTGGANTGYGLGEGADAGAMSASDDGASDAAADADAMDGSGADGSLDSTMPSALDASTSDAGAAVSHGDAGENCGDAR
jgi:hypothetical protein